jgi:hypothetical protein
MATPQARSTMQRMQDTMGEAAAVQCREIADEHCGEAMIASMHARFAPIAKCWRL